MRSVSGAILWVVLTSQVCVADPFIERVWPPVVQRGKTCRIELSGSQLDQAVGVWTSVPDTLILGTPSGQRTGSSVALDLVIPPQAPLGLYGIRLATPSGLSNVHLFLIDELAATEAAPSASSSAETIPSLTLPACIAAPVRAAVVDRYALNVTAGQRLTLEVIGNRLGKNYDPVVTIRDHQGKFVARCDNSQGLMFDCRFAHTFAQAGRYVIEVNDSRYAGDPAWSYVLRVGEFPAVSTALPGGISSGSETEIAFPQWPGLGLTVKPRTLPRGALDYFELRLSPEKPATWIPLAMLDRPAVLEKEPNNSFQQATMAASPLSVSAELFGVLNPPGDEDWFQFPLAKGQTLRVRGLTKALGSAADLELILYEPAANEPAGREVLRNDETSVNDPVRNTQFVDEANFTFAARTDGLHRLLVRDLTGGGSPAHTYAVDIGENSPELRLTSEISEATVPKGNWQPWPLKITRTGFQGPIELELVGAPSGITLEPTTIPAEANEFVCRLIASPTAAESVATLQIIGLATAQEQTLTAVATTHPLIDRQTANKDRQLTALRPDQRELPPSLANRLALQVTAPAPFQFELPDEQVLLPKYQTADIRLATRREANFSEAISFSARGGQMGDEREERVQLYFRAPEALPDSLQVTGTLFNRILTQYQKHRVDVTATTAMAGRTISLTRTFHLEIKPAFEPKFEPAELEVQPGQQVTAKVTANRVSTYQGVVVLSVQNAPAYLKAPEEFSIAPGQPDASLEFTVKPETNPGRYELRYESVGYVGKFQELVRGPVLIINVKKPEVKK